MLIVNPKELNKICTHAESIYPEECCGLLLGKSANKHKIVTQVWQTENSWNNNNVNSLSEIEEERKLELSKRNRFTIAPEVMLQAQKAARDSQLAIIGIYHSHPDHQAVPSEFDRAIAWQEYSYLIISVSQGQVSNILSWTLDNYHQFQSEDIKYSATR